MKSRRKSHGGANMGKDRNLNSAEIVLFVNVFPVQSGFREKGKKNDFLAMVNINISISIMAPKTKINMRLVSFFGRERFELVRDRASALGHVPLDQGTTTHDRRGLLSLKSPDGRWYGCAHGKHAVVSTKGGARMIGGRRFLMSKSIWMM